MKRMTPLAFELGNALLKRHLELCIPLALTPGAITPLMIAELTIPYKVLCESIGADYITENVGKYLNELAEWCQEMGLPPINALAVNGKTGTPGPGYFLAAGCRDWEQEVRDCIVCKGYPPHLPRNA